MRPFGRGYRHRCQVVCRCFAKPVAVSAVLAFLWPSIGLAQSSPMYPVPNELALGLGIPRDHTLAEWTGSLVAAFSFDYDATSRAVLVMEGELLGLSEAEACRPNNSPDTCGDAAFLLGLRLRRAPHQFGGAKPFAHVLAGGYWKGSAVEGQWFESDHFAMQVGGGIDFRRTGSFHGFRMSLDYRHVFAGDRDRRQTRVLFAYLLGPRRF